MCQIVSTEHIEHVHEKETHRALSRRTWYPTSESFDPGEDSHLSSDTLSATEMAYTYVDQSKLRSIIYLFDKIKGIGSLWFCKVWSFSKYEKSNHHNKWSPDNANQLWWEIQLIYSLASDFMNKACNFCIIPLLMLRCCPRRKDKDLHLDLTAILRGCVQIILL